MALTITDQAMTSDLTTDTATRRDDGRWSVAGPLLGRPRVFDRNQATTAMVLAEHLHTWGAHHRCVHVDAWNAELHTAPSPPTPLAAAPSAGLPLVVRCLYCGCTDIAEKLIVVDERTSEYALECAECHGVWAQ
jgi:hypothetical protein